MGAQLVQLEAGREVAKIPLVGKENLIGRDPSVRVRVSAPRVSRQHAAVHADGDRHTIRDLGSANGTTVNGKRVTDAVTLEPGDLIEIGGEIAFRYEIERNARSPRLPALFALSALLAFAAGGAWVWMRDQKRDLVLEQATERAREGLEASRAGDLRKAKSSLQHAYGLLYRNGQLDQVQQGRMQFAMQLLGKRVGGDADLWSVFQDVVEETRPTPVLPPIAEATRGCRLDAVSSGELEPCLRAHIELVMVGLRQDPKSVPETFHRQVAERLRKENSFLKGSLERGRPLVPDLRRELEAARMPPLLHYMALIESGYKQDAVSPAKAVGLWQLMPGTARQFGLVVKPPVDERRDPAKSTRVAARYLRDLTFEFGGDALLLAVASYNRGENGVRRSLKKLDDPFSDRSFWRLAETGNLPGETALYVPRFMAAAVAGEGGLPPPTVLAEAGY